MSNPLNQYMRQIENYISLPSKMKFYEEGVMEPTKTTGEIGVKGMTASDEIAMNTPDGILNGQSILDTIKSCCPTIYKPEDLTMNDVNALIVAIKKATYGDTSTIIETCEKCKTETEFDVSLGYSLDTMTFNADEYPLAMNENLTVYLKPSTFHAFISLNLKALEASKLLGKMSKEAKDGSLDLDETLKNTAEFQKMSRLNLEILLDGIHYVKIGDEVVSDKQYIEEWVIEISGTMVEKIRAKQKEINETGVNTVYEVSCPECDHSWKLNFENNPTNFF